MNNPPKIFGIGLSKTGTTSLARALTILGYRTRDYIGAKRYVPGDLSSIDIRELNVHDAFTDTPIPSFYKELDAAYPHSKFILTVRNPDDWLKSCKKQFTRRSVERQNEAENRIFLDLYGCAYFDKERFAAGYRRFVAEVLDHFKDRPSDLLILDICGGDGWEALCEFLGCPVPKAPFPVANVTEIEWVCVSDVISLAKRAAERIPAAGKGMSAECTGSEKGLLDDQARGFGMPRGVLGRVLEMFRRHRYLRAANGARKVISGDLKRLTPATPVLCRGASSPFHERRYWPYLWMIHLSDQEVTGNGAEKLSINIALLEGGRPRVGVVYFPVSDTVYFTGDKGGSFKVEKSREPHRLRPDKARAETPVVLVSEEGDVDAARIARCIGGPVPCSEVKRGEVAQSLCRVAEGAATLYFSAGGTQEWQTAAAHAVVNSAGGRVMSCDLREELAYNKASFDNGPFVAGRIAD